jgi:hypothetical protein
MTLRVAATIFYALSMGALSAEGAYDLDPPGILGDAWNSPAGGIAIVSLGVVVGAFVGRWWVLLSALAPVAVATYLLAIGHEGFTLEVDAVWNLILSPIAVTIAAVPLLIGLGLRKVWDARRQRRPPGPGASPTAASQ